MEASTRSLITDRNVAERRLVAIARAIEAHRNEQKRKPYPTRTEDLSLYQRARETLGAGVWPAAAPAGLPARSRSRARARRWTPSATSPAGTGAKESRRLAEPPSSMKSGPATKVTPSTFAWVSRALLSTSSFRSSQRK